MQINYFLFCLYIILFSYFIDSYICNKLLLNKWNFNKIKWLIDRFKSILINIVLFYIHNYYAIFYLIFSIIVYFIVMKNNIKSLMIHLSHLIKKDLINIKK